MTNYAKANPGWNLNSKYRKNHQIHPLLFPSSDLSYVLGVLKGDGYVSLDGYGHYKIALNVISERFIKSFRAALLRIKLKPIRIFIDRRGTYWTTAQSKEFYYWYKDLDFSKLKKFIEGYELDFIRGFYEAEGNISKSRYTYKMRISNTNYEILNMISDYLTSIGIKNTIHRYVNSSGCIYYQLGVYKDAELFLSLIKPSIKFLFGNKIIKDY